MSEVLFQYSVVVYQWVLSGREWTLASDEINRPCLTIFTRCRPNLRKGRSERHLMHL